MTSGAELFSPAVSNLERQQLKNRQQKMGKLALDGFDILGKTDSPYEYIRTAMKERIIDQDDALDSIIDSLDRSEVRLDKDSRPIACLAFLGPTGVGKSETAKVLAEQLSATGNIIKIDCSDYSQGHEVSSLVGSPPGYVSREQDAYLDSDRVGGFGTVVLFDEIEKGSPDLYNLMLQVMGDGQLRLQNGDITNFRDTVIILTSNLGAKEMSAQLTDTPLGFGDKQRVTDRASLGSIARKGFTEFFSPEFTNRLNKLVVFHPLSEDGLGKVFDTKMTEIEREYDEIFDVRLSVSDVAKRNLINLASKEPHLGARPLVRAIEDNVQTTFGRHLGVQDITGGSSVRVFHNSELPQDQSDDREFVLAIKPGEPKKNPSTELAVTAESYFSCEADEVEVKKFDLIFKFAESAIAIEEHDDVDTKDYGY